MKKNILVLSLTLLLCISGILVGKKIFKHEEQKEDISSEIVEELKNNNDLETEMVDSPSTTLSDIKENEIPKENKTKVSKEESTINSRDNVSSNIPKVEQKEIEKEKPIEKAIDETPKQEELPKVDEEYERLKKQVQYKTYEECMRAGFEIAEKDTVNILGFSCPYIVYKGEILGYRLQLEYSNPMKTK